MSIMKLSKFSAKIIGAVRVRDSSSFKRLHGLHGLKKLNKKNVLSY